MRRLFGRFQRLSAKPTGGETSTGLGLSIAKRIVDLHGGTSEAASERPGQGGAVFEIAPAGVREELKHEAAHAAHHVVDDEAPAREMVGDYLKDARVRA